MLEFLIVITDYNHKIEYLQIKKTRQRLQETQLNTDIEVNTSKEENNTLNTGSGANNNTILTRQLAKTENVRFVLPKHKIHKGPRRGKYYISKGRKVYI